jgi:hypothetical protein
MPTIAKAVTTTWKNAVESFRAQRRESTSKVLAETIALIEAAVPAYRLAALSHIERARRVSARSLVERCAQEAAPSDVAGLRRRIKEFPKRFEATRRRVDTLAEKIHTTPGWHTTPPTTEKAILAELSDDPEERNRIDNELTRAAANPMTLLGVAFEMAGEKWPADFGSVNLEVEGQEIADANQHVEELREALRTDPELLGAVATHYGVRPEVDEILRAAASRV